VSVPLAAIAAYAASQSSSHRRQERRARQMQLELLSIDPLLAPLPDTERRRIKGEYVPRVFGQPPDADTEDGTTSTSTIAGLLDALNKAVAALAKR
jgi:hypothetical protein